jgi:hypothetical protein
MSKPHPGTSKQQLGDVNRHDQVLIARTDAPGTDHLQYVWVLVCARRSEGGALCGHRYGPMGQTFTSANAQAVRTVRRAWALRA